MRGRHTNVFFVTTETVLSPPCLTRMGIELRQLQNQSFYCSTHRKVTNKNIVSCGIVYTNNRITGGDYETPVHPPIVI